MLIIKLKPFLKKNLLITLIFNKKLIKFFAINFFILLIINLLKYILLIKILIKLFYITTTK